MLAVAAVVVLGSWQRGRQSDARRSEDGLGEHGERMRWARQEMRLEAMRQDVREGRRSKDLYAPAGPTSAGESIGRLWHDCVTGRRAGRRWAYEAEAATLR